MVREAQNSELWELLELYLDLHENSVPPIDKRALSVWQKIMDDENHHIIVNIQGGRIVSSCVCVIIPNLTRGIRPYAFIENVVTREDQRGRGFATECLDFAREIAKRENCYRVVVDAAHRLKEREHAGFLQTCGIQLHRQDGIYSMA